jgi:Lar family restriction alleviation protein
MDTEPLRDCPFCADSKLDVIELEREPIMLAVRCKECGATGPRSESPHPEHAVHAWNQRFGRLSLVK